MYLFNIYSITTLCILNIKNKLQVTEQRSNSQMRISTRVKHHHNIITVQLRAIYF